MRLAPFLSARVCSSILRGMRWITTSDGQWTVELVHLTATGNDRDGDWLRVTHRGFYAGEARDWHGVARLGVEVPDLREVLRLVPSRTRNAAKTVYGRQNHPEECSGPACCQPDIPFQRSSIRPPAGPASG